MVQAEGPQTKPHIQLEVRPQELYVATYERLPFPNIGPRQEFALDLGIVARWGDARLKGAVFQGYSGHQLLFEQRWPARVIRRATGQEDLTIRAETGLRLNALYFLIHAYEQLTHLQITAVATLIDDDEDGRDGDENADFDDEEKAGGNDTGTQRRGQQVQAVRQVPVRYHAQQTDYHLPVSGTWWVVQAADWSDFHKSEVYSQPFAIDLVKLGPDNRPFAGNGRSLTDHYSYGEPVYAAAGGKVAYTCFDMPDMLPGAVPDQAIMRGDMRRLLGNAVAISHANGEFSYYAHLQQASIPVQVGDMVRRGTLIGHVGNSGNSPGPHLHVHVMNGPNLFIDQGLPFRFSHFTVAGQYYEEPMALPTRMIVEGPERDGPAGPGVSTAATDSTHPTTSEEQP